MADKSNQLILVGLSRAAAGGAPLLGSRAACGLFPSTAAGREAATRCQDEGYLCPLSSEEHADAKGRKGKSSPSYSLSDKGLAYLLGQVSPRQVLEDLVRALEERQTQLDELVATSRHTHDQLTSLRTVAETALRQLVPLDANGSTGGLNALFHSFLQQREVADAANGMPEKKSTEQACGDAVQQHLARWQKDNPSEDCPLPELYRQACRATPGLTIGQFHDVLRQMHDACRIYLHPWTRPLYDLPEPAFALLVGHEVAYYASLRS